MNAVLVMIGDVIADESAQVAFIQRDHMIEELAAATSDPALRHSILPWRLHARSLRRQTAVFEERHHVGIKLRVVIENHVSIRFTARECLAQLLQHPFCRGMTGNVGVQNLPTAMLDDKETVQKSEGDRWDSKEIQCDDHFTMILKEREPALSGVAAAMDTTEVSSYRAFGDLEAELQKLTVDLGCAPTGILLRQAANQVTNFLTDFRPAGVSARSPAPIPAERGPVPSDHSVRLDDNKRVLPAGPERAKCDPEQPIMYVQRWSRSFPFENNDLLAKSKDLQSKISAGTEESANAGE